jgi:acyl-CoA synthetase (AMP-forming)/AMP-acid ligase II
MTGDVGYLDADGFLNIVERKKDLILKAGFNVYPREVEEFINAHPKVEESAVIGVPDKHSGEEIKAYVVLRAGQHSSKEELISYCREKMAAYKTPKHVEFCGALPRGATGKVLKRVLREKKPGGAMPTPTPPATLAKVEAGSQSIAVHPPQSATPMEVNVPKAHEQMSTAIQTITQPEQLKDQKGQ